MLEFRASGVYQIVNTQTLKRYIGSSFNIHTRLVRHKRELRLGQHNNVGLQQEYNQYGVGTFQFEVLEFVSLDRKLLISREQHWLNFYQVLVYNTRPADLSLGFQLDESAKVKIGDNNRRRPVSDETRRKLSAAAKQRVWTQEQRDQQSERMRHFKHSEESKAKIGKAHKGKTLAEAHKQKVSEFQKNNMKGNTYKRDYLDKQK